MTITVALMTTTLVGCSENMRNRVMEGYGLNSVQPATADGFDYVVSVKNAYDAGVNLDKKADRDRVALSYIAKSCPRGRVVGEQTIETSEFLFGSPARTYALRIKCS